MSPARIHVEQSRNTLFFASCAKEVVTNAQVNVVVSDKALVKQLQRELARLESELRSSGHTSVTPDSTLLIREKDLQIEKVIFFPLFIFKIFIFFNFIICSILADVDNFNSYSSLTLIKLYQLDGASDMHIALFKKIYI